MCLNWPLSSRESFSVLPCKLILKILFIGFFEKNYLITKLDKYVWEEACRMIRRMMDEGREVIPLSINVSRTDFLFDDLCDVLVGLVDKYQIDPKYLKIEITESAYIDNPDKIVSMMTRLKEYEFIVVMDDFGTGYSSFNTLRTLPFDILKIDKGLIDEIDTIIESMQKKTAPGTGNGLFLLVVRA